MVHATEKDEKMRRNHHDTTALWYSADDEEYRYQDPEEVLQDLWDNREETDQTEFTIYAGHSTNVPFEDGDRGGMFQMGKTWQVTYRAINAHETFPKWKQIPKEQ